MESTIAHPHLAEKNDEDDDHPAIVEAHLAGCKMGVPDPILFDFTQTLFVENARTLRANVSVNKPQEPPRPIYYPDPVAFPSGGGGPSTSRADRDGYVAAGDGVAEHHDST